MIFANVLLLFFVFFLKIKPRDFSVLSLVENTLKLSLPYGQVKLSLLKFTL